MSGVGVALIGAVRTRAKHRIAMDQNFLVADWLTQVAFQVAVESVSSNPRRSRQRRLRPYRHRWANASLDRSCDDPALAPAHLAVTVHCRSHHRSRRDSCLA